MVRNLLVLSTLLLSGCGEAERSRFTPATANVPASSTADHRPGDGASREGAIPKNIPMH